MESRERAIKTLGLKREKLVDTATAACTFAFLVFQADQTENPGV